MRRDPRGGHLLRRLRGQRQPVLPGAYVCNTINFPLAVYKAAFTVGRDARATTDSIADYSSLGPRSSPTRRTGRPTASRTSRRPGVTIRSALCGQRPAYGSLQRHEHGRAARRRPRRADHLRQPGPARPRRHDRGHHRADRQAADDDRGCGLDSPTQVPNNVFGWGRIDALAAVQQAVAERPDLQVTSIEVVNNRAREHSATITATVANTGAMAAGASKTEFLIDGTQSSRSSTPARSRRERYETCPSTGTRSTSPMARTRSRSRPTGAVRSRSASRPTTRAPSPATSRATT